MRVVTTNDFVGSFFPQATSYGRLPGAAALQAAVDDLRTEADGALWIDTGDLAQGSALGALSDGVWPFVALRELSIDVAVAGNHELDWGDAHLRRWGPELPFPLLAANADLGLPPTALLSLGERTLGVIGLTTPDLPALHPGTAVDPDAAGLVVRHAARLRAEGADRVVLALHDGVVPVPAAATSTDSSRSARNGQTPSLSAPSALPCARSPVSIHAAPPAAVRRSSTAAWSAAAPGSHP